jgi:hypothetical protein
MMISVAVWMVLATPAQDPAAVSAPFDGACPRSGY